MLTSYFRNGDLLHSRSVSGRVFTDTLQVPEPTPRVRADWQRELATQLDLEAGDVEVMPLARTQMRWPDTKRCVLAMSDWTRALGLHDVLAASDMALMACRGARYHHDGEQYGGAAFCNLFLSEDKGLDLHFPSTNHRIPLRRGTAVLFDTGAPHGVIRRGSDRFSEADFPPDQDDSQIFLTWELPIADERVARLLGVVFDTVTSNARRPDEEGLVLNGSPAVLCPATGRWLPAD
jgi:hypothetical protein